MRISTKYRLGSWAPLTALLVSGAHCSSKGSPVTTVAAVDASGLESPSTGDGGKAISEPEAGETINDSGAEDAATFESVGDGNAAPPMDAAEGGNGAQPVMPDSGLPDAGSDGNGDRTIGPMYMQSPLLTPGSGPKGKLVSFTMQGSESQLYKGINGNYMRPVTIYIPEQYVPGTPAPLIVSQDAMGIGQLNVVLDNLIAMKMLPAIVVFFVSNGGGDAQGSERGLEYDTVSGLFAEFINTEVLPRGINEVKTQLDVELAITDDPNGRGTFGGSSGGAASFSMAWWHPDMFRRVLTYSGTYVSQVPDGSPFPHGCWVYHDVDPHFTSMTDPPMGLIVQHCEPASGFVGSSNPGPCDTPLSLSACVSMTGCVWNDSVNRPIRAWIESADGDLGTPGHLLDVKYGPIAYRDFDIANQRMAQAFALRGYPYHYDHALSAGHVDPNVVGQTLPEALLWVWRGYPVN
jgi:enterochelin esterase family protein